MELVLELTHYLETVSFSIYEGFQCSRYYVFGIIWKQIRVLHKWQELLVDMAVGPDKVQWNWCGQQCHGKTIDVVAAGTQCRYNNTVPRQGSNAVVNIMHQKKEKHILITSKVAKQTLDQGRTKVAAQKFLGNLCLTRLPHYGDQAKIGPLQLTELVSSTYQR